MKTLALSAILLLSSCYDSARVREIGTQGAIIHSAPPPERGRIGSAWDTIQARALFGVGLANKNGRVYLPFWVGWDSGIIEESDPPYIQPLNEK